MARALSSMVLKGIAGIPAARSSRIVCRSYYYVSRTRYKSEAYEGFRPAKELESGGLSLKDVVEQDFKENPVMIYMAGVPDFFFLCGWDEFALKTLQRFVADVTDVPVCFRDICGNPELINAVKALSNFPIFPQIFIKGEFFGGTDTIHPLQLRGKLMKKLKEKMKDIAASQERSE